MPQPALDARQLELLCALARLRPPAELRADLTQRLGSVLAAFATLGEVDTAAALPATPAAAPLRPDEPGSVLASDAVLANAGRTAAGCFVVPRVVEG